MLKIINFYCSVCGRYLGSVAGEENIEEAKKLYQISDEGVCWKCERGEVEDEQR
jgi:hypothetical protein